MKTPYLLPSLIFVFLFILLSSAPVFADTILSANPHFDDVGVDGGGVAQAADANELARNWVATCYDATGCANISIQKVGNQRISYFPLANDSPIWTYSFYGGGSSGSQAFKDYFNTQPASWYNVSANTTLYANISYYIPAGNLPALPISLLFLTNGLSIIKGKTLNATAGVWHNDSLILPPVNYNRTNLYVQFVTTYNTGGLEYLLYMDNFYVSKIDNETPYESEGNCTPYVLPKNQCNNTWIPGSDSTQRGWTSYDGCNEKTGSCPLGTYCEQLTPQVNVSAPLIENYTNCNTKTIFGTYVKCTAVCYKDFYGTWHFLITNCPTDCRKYVCEGQGTGIWPNWIIPPQVYVTTNPNSITLPSYTIACINATDGMTNNLVVDNNGTNTTEGVLIKKFNPSFTCPNTTYNCFNTNCDPVICYVNVSTGNPSTPGNGTNTASYGYQFDSLIGMPYIAMIVAFFSSLIVSIFVFLSVKVKSIETFIIPFMVMLAFFALPGIEFFPSWFLILQAVGVGMLIFFKVKG